MTIKILLIIYFLIICQALFIAVIFIIWINKLIPYFLKIVLTLFFISYDLGYHYFLISESRG